LVLLSTPLIATPTDSKTYNQTFSANGAGTITVPDFNTSAGTLDSITLTLSLGSTTGYYIPTTQTNGPFTGHQSTLESLLGNDSSGSSSSGSPSPSHGAGPGSSPSTADTGDTTGPGDTTFAHPHETPFANSLSNESIIEHLTPSEFAAWEDQNNGKVDLDYSGGNVDVGGTTFGNNAFLGLTGNEKITVAYTFTPEVAAEPAGKYLTALAAGAAALLLLRRKLIS
jgi:hypothetical protein